MSLINTLPGTLPTDLEENKYLEALENLTVLKDPMVWDGAVNIVFIEDQIAFIRRSMSMPSHKGQIAFIGGRKEEGENPLETARREFEEETHLNASDLDFLGMTPPVFTSGEQKIITVVQKYKNSKENFIKGLKSNGEWTDFYLVDSKEFMNQSGWIFANRYGQYTKGILLYHPILNFETIVNEELKSLQSLHFWGASARMLWNLLVLAGVNLKQPKI